MSEPLEQRVRRIADEMRASGLTYIGCNWDLEFARRLLAEQGEPVAWWRYEGDFADKFEKGWFQREKPESNGIALYAAPSQDALDAKRLQYLFDHAKQGALPIFIAAHSNMGSWRTHDEMRAVIDAMSKEPTK